jgi:hypothetical protein
MELTLNELEIMRQSLYSKAYKMESEINKSYSKTGPSARLDKKGAELDEVISLMNKINNEILIKMGLKVNA